MLSYLEIHSDVHNETYLTTDPLADFAPPER